VTQNLASGRVGAIGQNHVVQAPHQTRQGILKI
jgi:hypothetical protein